jgi:DNA-binding Lrp family transcriptional regulator
MPAPVPARRAVGGASPDFLFWAIGRASLEYVRDTIEITRGDHELLDALILTTALDANMTPVKRAPDLQSAYGGAQISAPDRLRRPVSINAVAQSLNLPFETVRRRAQKMADAGLCVIGARGMVVPHSAVTLPGYLAAQRARYERAREFYRALKAVGVLPASAMATIPSSPADPPVRAANWALSEYVLRACSDLIALTGNVTSSRVLVELALANTRALATAALMDWADDPLRTSRPVRVAALAGPLRLPRETVRRHLHRLETLGFCRRRSDGAIAVASASTWPRLVTLAKVNQANVQRLFAGLGQSGILADWDQAPDR